jgi:hypothetical protein
MLALNSHAKLGKIWYEKNFWSGKTTITVDGIELTRLNSVMYTYEKDGVKYTVVVQGNVFTGVKLVFSCNEAGVKPIVVPIVERFKVYEYLVAFITTIIVCLWINVCLFAPIPILRMNALEGVLCGVLSFVGLFLAGRTESTKLRAWIFVAENVLGLGLAVLLTFI